MRIGIISKKPYVKALALALRSYGFDVKLLGGGKGIHVPSSLDFLVCRRSCCSHAASDVALSTKKKGLIPVMFEDSANRILAGIKIFSVAPSGIKFTEGEMKQLIDVAIQVAPEDVDLDKPKGVSMKRTTRQLLECVFARTGVLFVGMPLTMPPKELFNDHVRPMGLQSALNGLKRVRSSTIDRRIREIMSAYSLPSTGGTGALSDSWQILEKDRRTHSRYGDPPLPKNVFPLSMGKAMPGEFPRVQVFVNVRISQRLRDLNHSRVTSDRRFSDVLEDWSGLTLLPDDAQEEEDSVEEAAVVVPDAPIRPEKVVGLHHRGYPFPRSARAGGGFRWLIKCHGKHVESMAHPTTREEAADRCGELDQQWLRDRIAPGLPEAPKAVEVTETPKPLGAALTQAAVDGNDLFRFGGLLPPQEVGHEDNLKAAFRLVQEQMKELGLVEVTLWESGKVGYKRRRVILDEGTFTL